MAQIYIIIAIAALAIIAGLLVFTKRISPKSKLSPLAGLAFVFIIAGIIFGESRLVGYSLMGVGLALALFDIIKKLKK
jgi:hypothetical protein